MRIVIDTNVFISATFWKGDSFKIIEKVENKEIELIISQEIIEEYSNVLNYEEIRSKVKINELETNFILRELVENSIIVVPKIKFDIIKTDSDDNKFIDVAVEGNVDYIVSQDKDLLDIKEFQGIKIVKPVEFLNELSKPFKKLVL